VLSKEAQAEQVRKERERERATIQQVNVVVRAVDKAKWLRLVYGSHHDTKEMEISNTVVVYALGVVLRGKERPQSASSFLTTLPSLQLSQT
jgi:hypothetical protein